MTVGARRIGKNCNAAWDKEGGGEGVAPSVHPEISSDRAGAALVFVAPIVVVVAEEEGEEEKAPACAVAAAAVVKVGAASRAAADHAVGDANGKGLALPAEISGAKISGIDRSDVEISAAAVCVPIGNAASPTLGERTCSVGGEAEGDGKCRRLAATPTPTVVLEVCGRKFLVLAPSWTTAAVEAARGVVDVSGRGG